MLISPFKLTLSNFLEFFQSPLLTKDSNTIIFLNFIESSEAIVLARSRDLHRSTHFPHVKSFTILRYYCTARWFIARYWAISCFIFYLSFIMPWSRIGLHRVVKNRWKCGIWTNAICSGLTVYERGLSIVRCRSRNWFIPWWIFFQIYL